MKPPLLSRLWRFTAVGVVGLPINVAVFALAVSSLHYLAAGVVAWWVAASVNFALNWQWTYDRPPRPMRRYPRALLVRGSGAIVSLTVLFVLVRFGGADSVIAQGVAATAGFVINFTGAELWTFAGRMTDSVAKRVRVVDD